MIAAVFILSIVIRGHLQPHLGPPLPLEERQQITWGEKIRLLRAGLLPLLIVFSMTGQSWASQGWIRMRVASGVDRLATWLSGVGVP